MKTLNLILIGIAATLLVVMTGSLVYKITHFPKVSSGERIPKAGIITDKPNECTYPGTITAYIFEKTGKMSVKVFSSSEEYIDYNNLLLKASGLSFGVKDCK